MNIARRDCIWSGQCGLECRGKCDDFTPADEDLDNESFYMGILKENARFYDRTVREFMDGSEDLES